VTDRSTPSEHERRNSPPFSDCAQVREEVAVALLVDGDPGPEVLTHLEGCPPCRDEYLELAALPALLAAAREAASGPLHVTPMPSVHLLERLLSEVARRRRPRHLLTAMATAAAVVAIVVPAARLIDRDNPGLQVANPAAAAAASGSRPSGSSDSFAGSGSNPADGARVEVTIAAAGQGSAVSVSVYGIPDGGRCRLVVHDVSGHAVPVGWWVVDQRYGQQPYVEQVALSPASIAQVELVDDQTGRQIVDVPIHQD
jgi:hypothetical protein